MLTFNQGQCWDLCGVSHTLTRSHKLAILSHACRVQTPLLVEDNLAWTTRVLCSWAEWVTDYLCWLRSVTLQRWMWSVRQRYLSPGFCGQTDSCVGVGGGAKLSGQCQQAAAGTDLTRVCKISSSVNEVTILLRFIFLVSSITHTQLKPIQSIHFKIDQDIYNIVFYRRGTLCPSILNHNCSWIVLRYGNKLYSIWDGRFHFKSYIILQAIMNVFCLIWKFWAPGGGRIGICRDGRLEVEGSRVKHKFLHVHPSGLNLNFVILITVSPQLQRSAKSFD